MVPGSGATSHTGPGSSLEHLEVEATIFVGGVGHNIATGLPDSVHAIPTLLYTSWCPPLSAPRTGGGIIQYLTGTQSGLQDHKSILIRYAISREHSGAPP